jgi:hypothetical protein
MMRINKLLPTLGILLILSGGVFAQERVWKTFISDDSGWSILAPGAMLPDAAALESPSTMGSYSYNDSKGFFSVIYRDTPKGRILWSRKKSHYGKVRDNFIKKNNGQLLKDAEFSNGKTEGREIYVKIAEGDVMARESQIKTKYRVHRMRMFFNDRRFYIILAVLPEELIDTPAINNYFNSFVIK